MRNPVEALRLTLGMDRREFGELTGTSYHTIYAVETGRLAALPKSLLRGIEAIGLNRKDLQQAYQTWRTSRVEERRREVQNQLSNLDVKSLIS